MCACARASVRATPLLSHTHVKQRPLPSPRDGIPGPDDIIGVAHAQVRPCTLQRCQRLVVCPAPTLTAELCRHARPPQRRGFLFFFFFFYIIVFQSKPPRSTTETARGRFFFFCTADGGAKSHTFSTSPQTPVSQKYEFEKSLFDTKKKKQHNFFVLYCNFLMRD